MKAIIPAAGYATRMYPLTKDMPKTLLKIADRPILEHIIGKILEISDINEIVVVTNAKFYEKFVEWNSSFKCRVPVKIINDKTSSNEDRLGSVGDINLCIETEKIGEDIIIVNSDNLFTFDLNMPLAFSREKNASVIGMYDTKSIEESKKMGAPEIDSENRVIGFVEKPSEPKTTLSGIGIYFYTKEDVPLFKKYLEEGNSADKTGEFVEWVYKKTPVFGFVFCGENDKWFDIGSLETFEQAQSEFPKWGEKK